MATDARSIWHVSGTRTRLEGFRADGDQQGKRQFGSIRKLPSGRFQARYTGPDGHVRGPP